MSGSFFFSEGKPDDSAGPIVDGGCLASKVRVWKVEGKRDSERHMWAGDGGDTAVDGTAQLRTGLQRSTQFLGMSLPIR